MCLKGCAPCSTPLPADYPSWVGDRPQSNVSRYSNCRFPLDVRALQGTGTAGAHWGVSRQGAWDSDCHFQEGCDSLRPPYCRGLAVRWSETFRSAASMLPCPRISSEVRPKSPHLSRLRPTPSSVPRVQDNITILIRRNPRWVQRFMSVGCPTRRPSRS